MLLRTLIFVLLSGQVSAQQLFHTVTGTWTPDFGYSGAELYDGFLGVGTTGAGGNGNSDILLVRTNNSGNLLWQRSVGFSGVEQGHSVVLDSDSGFVIAGYTNSTGAGGYDVLLMKTDTTGAVKWHKTYGGADWDLGYRVINDISGGFTIAGQTFSNGAQNGDGYLIRTNAAGSVLWEKKFGGPEEDGFYSLRQTQDGGYVMCGYSKSFNPGKVKELYVVRTNSAGGVLWETTFGDTVEFVAKDIEENYDGGFLVAGYGKSSPDSADVDIMVMRIGPNGQVKTHFLLDHGGDDFLNGVTKRDQQTFMMAGMTSYGGNDGFLPVVDTSGSLIGNATTFGDPLATFGAKDNPGFIMRTSFNQFLVVGSTESYLAGRNQNIFIATFNANGSTVSSPRIYVGLEEEKKTKGDRLKILSDGSSVFTIEVPRSLEDYYLKVSDVTGKIIIENSITTQAATVDLSSFSSGVYFVTVTGTEKQYVAKVFNP